MHVIYYVVRQAEPGRSFVLFTDTHLRYLLPACLRSHPQLGSWPAGAYGPAMAAW
jgi:hypothetical protein